ncbi:hypothetical protein KW805_03460 [Candidatus Pacearchaeota archaeon]|nr:hypothetical protein [Candidatus Pacearchaeota archaeon]
MPDMMKQAPTGVKIISIIDYIGGGLGILFGILLMFGSSVLETLIPGWVSANDGGIFTQMFIIFGIIVIIFGVVAILLGRGLWKGKRWARIWNSVFAIFGILGAISNIVSGNFGSIVSLAINGWIAWYLFFNKSAKAFFSA